ncbi:MAG: tetratricopeptide repeat protein, partial [Leptolyngbyaceae cyanobacterium bins.302]|nr:tetratricopeptide repeat protein [Leptolyngbyaceae cyanobacterium bins.302]
TALKDVEGAIVDYSEAIRLNPTLAEAYLNRGRLHLETGNRQATLTDWQQAAKLFEERGDLDRYQQMQDAIEQLQQGGK